MIIEVLSPSTAKKDLNEKFNLYQEVGVKEYWVVFPDAEEISVYLLENEKYVLVNQYEENDQVPVNILPGLVVNLEDVFPVPN
jgi:Uma2 family endonuclease